MLLLSIFLNGKVKGFSNFFGNVGRLQGIENILSAIQLVKTRRRLLLLLEMVPWSTV